MNVSVQQRVIGLAVLAVGLVTWAWWWYGRDHSAAPGVAGLSQWAPQLTEVTVNKRPLRMAFEGDDVAADEQVFPAGAPVEVAGSFVMRDELLPEFRLNPKQPHSQLNLGVFSFESFRPGENRITRHTGIFAFEFEAASRKLTFTSVGTFPPEPGTYVFKILLQRPSLGDPERELIVFFQTYVRISTDAQNDQV